MLSLIHKELYFSPLSTARVNSISDGTDAIKFSKEKSKKLLLQPFSPFIMPGCSHQCNVWLNGAGFEQTALQHQLLLQLALSKKKNHHQEAILLSYTLIVKFPIICNVKQEETKEEIPKQMRFRVPDIFRLIVRAMNPYSHSFTPRHPHGRTKPLQKFGFFQEC